MTAVVRYTYGSKRFLKHDKIIQNAISFKVLYKLTVVCVCSSFALDECTYLRVIVEVSIKIFRNRH